MFNPVENSAVFETLIKLEGHKFVQPLVKLVPSTIFSQTIQDHDLQTEATEDKMQQFFKQGECVTKTGSSMPISKFRVEDIPVRVGVEFDVRDVASKFAQLDMHLARLTGISTISRQLIEGL